MGPEGEAMLLKRLFVCGGLLALVCGSTGCSAFSNTAQGAGVGGLLGAGAGAAIGSASGHAGKGAAIGGLLGAGAGGLIGNDIDQQEKRQRNAELAATRAELANAQARPTQAPLGMTDIIRMTQQNLGEAVIIEQIRSTHSTFTLSNQDIEWLKQNGVCDGVILEMQRSRPGPVATQVIRQPVIYAEPAPVYIYRPYCPPPPVGFSFGYVRVR
jgi:outer membrane lipoprotein SlyB